MAEPATIDAAASAGDQTPQGRTGSGGGSRKPKMIVFGKPFSGGAFVSYVIVNRKTVPEFNSARLRENDEVTISGGGLIAFTEWAFFQKGKAPRRVLKFTGRSDNAVSFMVPKEWEGYFIPDASILLTFTNKEKNVFWGVPVAFLFGKEGEKRGEERGKGQGGATAAGAEAAAGRSSQGPTGLMMDAMGEALFGVTSPFLPNADRSGKRKALADALKSGDRKKIEQAVNNLKALGDADGLREAAKTAPKEYAGLLNEAIYDVNQQKIMAAEAAHNLSEIADSASIDDFGEGVGEGGQAGVETGGEAEIGTSGTEEGQGAGAAGTETASVEGSQISGGGPSAEITSQMTGAGGGTVTREISGGGTISGTVGVTGAGAVVSSSASGGGEVRAEISGGGTSVSGSAGTVTAEVSGGGTTVTSEISGGGGGARVEGELKSETAGSAAGQVPSAAGGEALGKAAISSESKISGQAAAGAAVSSSAAAGAVASSSAAAGAAASGAAAGGFSIGSSENREIVGKYLSKKPEVITGPKINAKIRIEVLQALATGNGANLSPEGRLSLQATLKALAQSGAGHPGNVQASAGQLQTPSEAEVSVPGGARIDGITTNPDQAEVEGGEAGPEEEAAAPSEAQPAEDEEGPEEGQEPAGEGAPAEEKLPGEEVVPLKEEEPTPPAGMEDMARNAENLKDLQRPRQEPAPSEQSAEPADKEEKPEKDKQPSSRLPEAHEPGEPAQDFGEPEPLPPRREGEAPGGETAPPGGPEQAPGSEHLPKPGAPLQMPEAPEGAAEAKGAGAAKGAEAGAAEGAEVGAAGGAAAGAELEAGAAAGGPVGIAAVAASQLASKGGKEALIKQAADLVNPAMNGFLIDGAIWVWTFAIPTVGLSVLLGAFVGDLLFLLKKRLIESALSKVWLAQTIVGKEVTADEIADEIQFSAGVKANVASMNAVSFLLVVLAVIFIGATAYLGCTYPFGDSIAKATDYKLTILGNPLVGLGSLCKALSNANWPMSAVSGTIAPSIPSGSCNALSSGDASPAQLALTCFGPNTNIDTTASIVAAHESGGLPSRASTVDKCLPGGQPVSFGLFQINITNHKINGLNCPAAFDYPPGTSPREYDAKNQYCTIVDQTLYNNCVTAAETPSINIQAACQISSNGTNWGAWLADINACGISRNINPGT